MKNYKYLTDLGVKPDEQYLNWLDDLKNDSRSEKWKKQREIYGIDERETWSWSSDYMDYCYIHLKMFNEVNCVNLNYHTIVFGGKEYTVQETIDQILCWFEYTYYPERDYIFDSSRSNEENVAAMKTYEKGLEDTLMLLAKIMPYLWW